ncbi:hypothetical protein HD597_011321 [Nonomuraea thailandensis]|uniref:Peptidase C51 domain-containing protein n=1 Tax=Nonomuraea thailandensis TaxID=1188745 RepID=A0A9X2KBS8_9ACTN|nr:CHAP domain-containing protein [Nonomuraea thailandensis]MCP2364301.1 hypothetical protein [Nonomuraea thailandensis]
MSGAKAMLAEARQDLGLSGRPNRVTRWYAKRNGSEFLEAPWCDQSITYWAHESGNAEAVLPAGDRAYTVWHAQDGQRLGRWHAGTAANVRAHAVPGSVIFFDWGGTNETGAIDHVGLVEVNLQDGRVQTIEANTGDAVKRRIRGPEVIAGFWTPDYNKEDNVTGDTIYKATWETDAMPVPYGSETNKEWKPRSVLVDHGVQLRKILTAIEAQGATIKALADALAQQDQAVDVDALIGRIREEIERVTVRLDVTDTPQP